MIMKTTKFLCLLLLCMCAISCKQEKLDDSLMTFSLTGECLVQVGAGEPMHTDIHADRLKITPLSQEHPAGVLHFRYDTWSVQIADNEDTEGVEFIIPDQVHEFAADNYSTSLSGEGILTEQTIVMSYQFSSTISEGIAECECHGERILEE